MQIIRSFEIPVLRNAGVASEQLLFPESSPEAQTTLTRVTVPVGGSNPRHAHPSSEQIWFVLAGEGTLLLEGASEAPIGKGDVARFAPGDVHGFFNSGAEAFVYVSVTTPPLNFRNAYAQGWQEVTPR